MTDDTGAGAVGTPFVDDPVTLVGLVLESAAGLRHELGTADVGGSGQSFEILVRLDRSPGGALRMSDLAAQTGLTRSGLTRAVDRLVAAGLCERASCPGDRRGTYAVLRAEARPRITAAIAQHERDVRELLAGVFDAGEEAALRRLLAKMRDRVRPESTQGSAGVVRP